MEGKFLTKPQRQQLAQELKKTHFKLGGDSNQYSTTSKVSLKPPAERSQSSNFSKELKKSSFQIGQGSNCRISEFSKSFDKKDFNGLRPDIPKRDFKSHSSILGTMSTSFSSTTATNFHKPAICKSQQHSNKSLEKNLRKHHFTLGHDHPSMKSTFSQSFISKSSEKVEHLSDLKQDIRSSHFSFGQYPRVLVSTNSQHYSEIRPSSSCSAIRKPPTKDNLVLSQNQNSSQITTFASSFEGKQRESDPTSYEKVLDLKSSHFRLGSFPLNYSQASTQLKPKTAIQPNRKGNISIDVLASHFEITLPEEPRQKVSKGTKQEAKLETSAEAKIDPLRHLQSQISFSSTLTPQSSFQATYKKFETKDLAKPDGKLIKDLKSHHFILGSDQEKLLPTSSLLVASQGRPAKFDEKLAKDLISSHFTIGNQTEKHYLPIHKKDFKGRTNLKEDHHNLKKDLKNSHFEVGSGQSSWKTEQKSKFIWINPTPDSDYHPSLVSKNSFFTN